MQDKRETVCWPVPDDAMAGRIKRNDCAMVEKGAPASDGQVVLASVNGEEPILRRYSRHEDLVVLRADNPAYAPICAALGDVRIVGRVAWVRCIP